LGEKLFSNCSLTIAKNENFGKLEDTPNGSFIWR